jgi:hypothetical protein
MTVVFDDEELYTNLKVEAARSHRPAKDIVAVALQLYFEASVAEHEAILARRRSRQSDRREPAVERVLEELGLSR